MWCDGRSNTLSDRSKEPQGTVSFVVKGRCLGTARTGGWKLSQGLQNDHSLLCFSTKPYNMKRCTRMKNIHMYFTGFYVILNCRENQQISNFYDIWLPWKSPSKSPLCSLAFFKSSNNSLLCHVQGHKCPHNLQKWTHAFLNFLNFTGSVFICRHS